jgi:pyruvate dehydrogenase E2 component (dihydrolipoamide acetyltransferase)
MRQAIAAQVSLSRGTIPAFAIDRWVDLGLAEDTRAAFNARGGPALRLTLTDMLLQALADVLPAHPTLLSRWQAGDPPQIVTASDVAIGLAVALDEGLMIPVLDGLGGLGLDDIAQRRSAAVTRARSGRAGEDSAATLTVSNIGAAGADRFEAIINPGEAAILAMGRLRESVIAKQGAIRVARGATLTLSVDHRLIDGRTGAAFLAALAQRLEGGGWRA